MRIINFKAFLLSALLVVTACDSEELLLEAEGGVQSRSSITDLATVDFDVDQYFDSITAPERWIQYDSFREKLDVLNLPEEILPRLSNEQLAEACAKYPMRIIYMAYDTPAQGAQVIIDNFNGFQELAKRYNFQDALINRYIGQKLISAKSQSEGLNAVTESENAKIHLDGDKWLMSRYMEAVFQTDYFNKDLNQADALRLKSILESDLVQSSDTSAYTRNSKAKVLMKLQPSTYSVNSAGDYTYRFIYTFHGNEILVYDREDLPADILAEADKEYCKSFPNAILKGSSTLTYNCHYYAWVGTGRNKYWMVDNIYYNGKTYKNVENYMTNDVNVRASVNDSYTTVYGIDMNDIYRGTHSMHYNPSTGKYTSKWGEGPLMEHSENDMPYLIPNKQYFYHMEYGSRIVPQDGDRAYAVGEELILKITGIVLKSYLRYSIVLYTGKGDDALDEGKATMAYDGAYTIRATFNFPGVYELFITGTDSNGNIRENMSYQPVIEW